VVGVFGAIIHRALLPRFHTGQHLALGGVLSQISILGAKSENWVSEIQWLTDPKPLEKANLRQNRTA
jgi:hypothetical protein